MENNMFMTAEQVQELLHYQNIQTIYRKAKNGSLPAFHPPNSRRWLFPRDDIIEIVKEGS